MLKSLFCLLWLPVGSLQLYDDFHYPSEETAERSQLVVPELLSLHIDSCSLRLNGRNETGGIGDTVFEEWIVLGLMPDLSPPVVALERNFDRWGILAMVRHSTEPIVLRKSVGSLAGIRQPYFDLTSNDPAYFKKVADSQEDYPAQLASNLTVDGELDYPSLASTLAPTRDMVEISNAVDVVKFVVTHNGRVKCASYHDRQMNGITDFDDLHAVMPNSQTIIFDPANHTTYWPNRFENSKTGLVGNHLRIANIGSFSPSVEMGFEVVGFSPIWSPYMESAETADFITCEFVGPLPGAYIAGCSQDCHKFGSLLEAKRSCVDASDCNGVTLKNGNYELRSAKTSSTSTHGETSWILKNGDNCTSICAFSDVAKDSYVAGCSQGCKALTNLSDAQNACANAVDCAGITLRANGRYELRHSHFTNTSTTGESSWLLVNSADCHSITPPSPSPSPTPGPPRPRRPDINYNPGILVRFREQSNKSFGSFSYFYVSNDTRQEVPAKEFYSKLIDYHDYYSKSMATGMAITLPNSDRRQVDMAKSVLLSAWGNYVGDQSNYGNGATYWSIGREDNGSLPLNILSVEEANLEWGLCNLALPHIQFYHENYVRADGTINYYSWGPYHDSYGDAGRLVSLFVKATQLCSNETWIKHNVPYAEHLARWILAKRLNATLADLPPHQRGLVVGVPEHDWHATKDKYFYSNNVVLLRGMEEFGEFLTTAPSQNATLGKELLSDAAGFREDIMNSIKLCTVFLNGSAYFLPPIAETNFTPFERMTYGSWKSNRYPEYSNFRFYPESLLADVMPRELEQVLLYWHNHRGGRIGGASRWGNWLDDMPVTGWGYGALVNNHTDDFLALLYGHAATYQSRGTFHSTEQLGFQGDGWYRHFLHWPNPKPNESQPVGLQYYGNENDVSFCIVSQVIIARLTRWQLVFEDFYRPQYESSRPAIWLARGAPKRWFASGAGFAVASAPTRFGRVSYQMLLTDTTSAFNVSVPAGAPDSLMWVLRWPFNVEKVTCHDCEVLQVERHGVVTVKSAGTSSFVAQVQRVGMKQHLLV